MEKCKLFNKLLSFSDQAEVFSPLICNAYQSRLPRMREFFNSYKPFGFKRFKNNEKSPMGYYRNKVSDNCSFFSMSLYLSKHFDRITKICDFWFVHGLKCETQVIIVPFPVSNERFIYLINVSSFKQKTQKVLAASESENAALLKNGRNAHFPAINPLMSLSVSAGLKTPSKHVSKQFTMDRNTSNGPARCVFHRSHRFGPPLMIQSAKAM